MIGHNIHVKIQYLCWHYKESSFGSDLHSSTTKHYIFLRKYAKYYQKILNSIGLTQAHKPFLLNLYEGKSKAHVTLKVQKIIINACNKPLGPDPPSYQMLSEYF